MIAIDGSQGEGGGQVVRTALALALVTGEAVRITDIRGGRRKPGFMRQHVTAVEAACAIGSASCEGAVVGSSEILFRPGRVVPGAYRFAIGTAGSTGLVLQTVLMPLLLADAPSRLVIEGGTHNPSAPPFDFLERCFLPVLARMGAQVTARLVRHGFHPGGGGRIEVDIAPARLAQIECTDRGAPVAVRAAALITGLAPEIAEREIAVVRRDLGWSGREAYVRELPADHGPGNILLIEAQFEHATEIVSGFGQIGVTAERVAKTAVARMRGYLASDAYAGPYLADQLLLPFALAGGGAFTTVKPSQHSRTNAAVIERFTGKRCTFAATTSGTHRVVVG